jgi:MafB19-like deaminase
MNMAIPCRGARQSAVDTSRERSDVVRRAAPEATRRRLVLGALAGLTTLMNGSRAAQAQGAASGAASRPEPAPPQVRWYKAADAMKQLAMTWGDQPYGAVLVLGGAIAGEGPSRVVLRNDPTAHAEREAIRDAQRRLGRLRLDGSVLYSTSRPCPACERAAAIAGVSRMIHGASLSDAGTPSL